MSEVGFSFVLFGWWRIKHRRAFLIGLLTAAFLLQQAVCTGLTLGTMSHAGATVAGRIGAPSLSLGARDGADAVSTVLLGYLSIRWPASRRWIFLALVLAVIVSEALVRRARRPRMNVAFLYAGLVSLGLACGAWILDITRAVCLPTSWFQPHAMWHVLMAALIGFIYLSELHPNPRKSV